jgi:hypothetical protein
VISQLTNFGEPPLVYGVCRFWLKNKTDLQVYIEIQKGEIWAVYANKEFENKYPISADKICEFLNGN